MESKITLKIHLISVKVAMIEKTNDDKLEVLAKYRGRGIFSSDSNINWYRDYRIYFKI